MQTQVATVPTSLVSGAKMYWEKYLWHHRHPWTRRLHRMGSYVCLAGMAASLRGYGLWWTPLAIVVGYGFAFSGHWFVERNRPLTFENPLRAGIANWFMFGFEIFGDVGAALERLAKDPPDTQDIGDQ